MIEPKHKSMYRGMKVYASHDKTQCLLEIGIDTGHLFTTEQLAEWDSPIFLEGPTDPLKVSSHPEINEMYNDIKDEKYFVILKEGWE